MPQNLYGLGGYNSEQIKEMMSLVEETDLDAQEILLRRPDAASDPKTAIKNMLLSEAAFIVPDALAGQLGIEMIEGFSLPQLQEIGTNGDEYLRAAVKVALELALRRKPNNEHLQELKEYINQSPAWQF